MTQATVWTGRASGWRIAALLVLAALAILVGVPLAFVALQAVFPLIGRGSLERPLATLLPTLGDPALLQLGLNTIALGLGVVVVSGVIGIPLGYWRAGFGRRAGQACDILFLIPFMMPPYIATFGWIMALQPRGFLWQLVGFDAGRLIFSYAGIVLVMALHVFPVVYFATARSTAAVGSRLGDVARVFGATPWRALRRITLPLILPSLTGSLLLVFALTIEEYGTPAALGAQSGFDVLVTAIERRVADWPVDLPGAATLSLLLAALSGVAFWVQARVIGARSVEIGKPGERGLSVSRPRWRGLIATAFALVAVLAVGVPLAATTVAACLTTMSGGLAWSNLGLHQFRLLAADESGGLRALGTSLGLGAATAALACLVGTLTAYCSVKLRLRSARVMDALALMPSAMPGIVVAIGLILAWNQPALRVTPYNTMVILVLAYTCLLLPYPVRYSGAALRQVRGSLEDAARVAGATPLKTFRRVVFPLTAPSIIAAAVLVFAVASRELVASVLLVPVGSQTIATFIWRQFAQGSVGLGMAMSFVALVLTTTVPLVVTLALGRWGRAEFVA